MTDWPPWWNWEIELSPHLLKRMLDRQFTEVDLRAMMSDARGFREDIEPGRFAIETQHEQLQWEVIVEPDTMLHTLVIVTAYPVTSTM